MHLSVKDDLSPSPLYFINFERVPPGAIIVKNYSRPGTVYVGWYSDTEGKRQVFAGDDPDEVAYSIRRKQLGVL